MMNSMIEVEVTKVKQLTDVIREFTLSPMEGALPGFSSGSHIQLHLPTSHRVLKKAYSLLSDPADTSSYRIAVRLQEHSKGGSRFMHEGLSEGDHLHITVPSNLFAPNSSARHHLLIAGGIGITPFLSYLAEFQRQSKSYELHYAYRGGVTDAYVTDLRQAFSAKLHTYDSNLQQRLDLNQLLSNQPVGTHVYVCGPERLRLAVQEAATTNAWSPSRIHWEAFAAAEPGQPFQVELARLGKRLDVSADESLLEALEASGVEIPNLCRGGVCGQCATVYLEGDVEHRDAFLSQADQSQQLMPCVSRGMCGSRIVLDL